MNYWIVGAMWGGKNENDALEDFLKRGYWYCWDAKTTPNEEETFGGGNSVATQRKRFLDIVIGDRIAIKKNLSIKDQKIEIRALGIVKDIDRDEWRAYVNWIPLGEGFSREVNMRGCSASIHGPFQEIDPWVHQIFHI